MKRFLLIAAATTIAVSELSAAGSKESWPQWRGADFSGISTETNIPLEWDAKEGIRWRTVLPGRGLSSPVVLDGKIFLTTDVEGEVIPGAKPVEHILQGEPFKHPDSMGGDQKHDLRVLCVDAKSGKILWNNPAYSGKAYDNRHRKGSYAAPTMAAEPGRVFAFFGGEGLYCFDFKGSLLWSNSIGGIKQIGMGPGSSPVLSSRTVIVQCDQNMGTNSFMAGFDKKTGKELWRADRKVSAGWATPIVLTSGGIEQVIASGSEAIISYDAATGKEIWRHKGLGNNAVPTPVASGEIIYFAAGYPKKLTLAIRLGGKGNLTGSTNLVWKHDRGNAYVPSPILLGEEFYLMSDSGVLTCLDARTGEVRYDAERLPAPARFTASPVAVNGHLLLTSEEGDTFVVKAGTKHEVVRKNPIGEKVFASLALADGHIFIRGETNLFCIGK